jgi:hypothetical protein
MSEPDIIRSDRPHEVTIPEGSNKALAKTAAQQEPSVRKVLNEAGGEEVEHILPDKFVSDTPEQLAKQPDKYVNADAGANTRGPADAQAPARIANAPASAPGMPAGAAIAGRAPAALAPAGAQALSAASESLTEAVASSAAQAAKVIPAPDMPEMDFPARVVHLRIENELLQKRLDELDKDT